ncbi:MAG: hypothetical protein JSV52_11440 [Candidatus Zixiibacteriota bacterium]|nr:MAG: hypothetical protein JSV52_11440 [candidate division Zixibacteria bacterium]
MRSGNGLTVALRASSVLLLIWLSAVVTTSVSAQRRVNLPLTDVQVSIEGEAQEALRVFFSNFVMTDTATLGEQVEEILIGMVPIAYDSGCTSMIGHWGSDPTNVPGSLFRPIYVYTGKDPASVVVLMAYRCFSYRDYYRDTYYDERLTTLTITESETKLAFLPHWWKCKDILALSKISVAESYHIVGDILLSLVFSMSGENPCCNGPFSCDEEKINYYLIGEGGVRPVASVVKHKEDYYHNDVEGDTEVIYDAEITVVEDADGNALEIVSVYTIKENDELREEGTLRFIFNPYSGMFEEGME